MTDYEKAVHAAMVTIRESLDGATGLDKHGAMGIALAVSYTLAGYSPDQIPLLIQVPPRHLPPPPATPPPAPHPPTNKGSPPPAGGGGPGVGGGGKGPPPARVSIARDGVAGGMPATRVGPMHGVGAWPAAVT